MRVESETILMDQITELERLGDEAIAAGDVKFDLSGVKKADSALLALLIQWIRKAQQRGQQAEIINLPEGLWSLAKLYGVRELIRPYCKKL